MAVGDVYRAGVGTQTCTGDQTLNPATMTKLAFESELETACIYSIDAANDDLTVSTAGHYLVGYSLYGVATSNARQQHRAAILIDGTELTGLYGSNSSYSRNTANNTTAPTGMAIFDLSACATISIGGICTGGCVTAITQQDNQGGFWVVKLSDCASYARIRGPQCTPQALSTTSLTYADILIATNDELDTGFTHSANSADITLADAGLYFVAYGLQMQNNHTQRLTHVARLTLDGVVQNQSYSGRLSRNDNCTTIQQLNGFAMLRASACDILRIQAASENIETGGTGTDIEEVWITVMKLESDIDVLIQPLACGAQETNPACATVVDYDAPAEIDSGTFSEVGGRVTVAKTGHYLLTSSIHNFRQDTSGVRITQRTRARVNTTNDAISGGISYNRGCQGTDNNFTSVTTTQFLTADLTACDIIDITIQQDSCAVLTSRDITLGGQTAFRIEDLIAAGGVCIVKLVPESVNVTEAIVKLQTLIRAVPENVNLNEALVRVGGLIRTLPESVNINEANFKIRGLVKTLLENVNINDAVLKIRGLVKRLQENVNINEVSTVVTYEIVGVTRDKGGSTLGNCRVVLLKRDNVAEGSRIYRIVAHTNSDGSGNYTFGGLLDKDALYMIYAFNDAVPDVRGVTDDFLQPTVE